jgi:hypothetical protein
VSKDSTPPIPGWKYYSVVNVQHGSSEPHFEGDPMADLDAGAGATSNTTSMGAFSPLPLALSAFPSLTL